MVVAHCWSRLSETCIARVFLQQSDKKGTFSLNSRISSILESIKI